MLTVYKGISKGFISKAKQGLTLLMGRESG